MKDEEIKNVVEEISEQDLESQAAGAGAATAVRMTLARRCGAIVTVSYECTTPHRSCG